MTAVGIVALSELSPVDEMRVQRFTTGIGEWEMREGGIRIRLIYSYVFTTS
jgi:hypothetical protein